MSDSPEYEPHHACVTSLGHRQRLDRWLADVAEGVSRVRVQGWIEAGLVQVNTRSAHGKLRLQLGDEVQWSVPALVEESAVLAQDLDIDLLYSDADIAVINKPANWVMHPAAGHHDGTVQNALLHHFPQTAVLARAGLVHRLDKDTTGLFVVALNEAARVHLVDQLQARSVSRQYLALALGDVHVDGSIEAPIGRHPRERKKMAVHPLGKPAITHYRVLESGSGLSLLQVSLETGRTHQIRVHCAHMGHPLVGDPAYGRRHLPRGIPREWREVLTHFPRQALHAQRLRLVHPRSGKSMEWRAPIPEDLRHLLYCLGSDHVDGP